MTRFESKIVGIDLGTTNTVIGYYDEIGERGECCVNGEGTNLLPSAVYFEDSETYTVGTISREGALLHPDNTAVYFKRKMGVTKEAITVDGKAFSPQQVSALVLKEAVDSAESELEEKIVDAVITVPAYFDSDARQATIEAGQMAGLNVRDILDEPVAALYHCDSLNDLKGKVVLIFDLGGGTLDLVAAEVSNKEINEIAINGDIHLGGSDWDNAFVSYLKKQYLKGRTFEPDHEQEFLLNVEKAKKSLSKKEKTRITVPTKQGRVPIEVTRQEFDKCTEPLLNSVKSVIQELMVDLFDKGVSEFDKIIMVGGSTRMPQIEKLLRSLFPDTDIIAKDQDEAVAKGAAIYAKLLSGTSQGKRLSVKKSFKPKRLHRISTRSYGLAALLGEDGERKVCNIIFRSTELPVSKKKCFQTSVENQKQVNLSVYETTSNEWYVDIKPDALLGKCILEIENDLPKHSDIEVIFTLNENGVLTMEGREPKSGKSVKTTMESKALLEVDELIVQKGDIDNLIKIY